MDRTPDERREILRAFMAGRGLKPARWAKEAGVSANSIYNFLNGESEALSHITYAKLARTCGEPIWKLNGDEPEASAPTSTWVVGEVEAGAFKEAIEWDTSKWYEVDVPVPPRFRGRAKALQVRGPSMDIEYPDGSIVIWVDMLDFRGPRDGDHVIVYSYSADDGGIEATIKEYRTTNGAEWLWPKSHDPNHQQPIDTRNPGAHVTRIEIKGIVIGGYRPRII